MVVEMAAVAAMKGQADSITRMLERDIRLIRPAILYADHITLTSIAAKLIVDRDNVENMPVSDRLDLAIRASIEANGWPLRRFSLKEVIEIREAFIAFGARNPSDMSFFEYDVYARTSEVMSQIVAELNQYWDDFVVTNFGRVKDSSGYSELELAIESGILTISPLNDGESGMETAQHFLDILGETLGNPNVYPLIDENLSELIGKGFASGRFKSYDSLQSRSGQAVAGTGFIRSLPAFPRAKVRDLLVLREAIQDNRSAYQAEVARLAESIKGVAFSTSMVAEAQDQYVRTVEPILRQLEQQMLDKRFRSIIRTNLTNNAGGITAATLRAIVGLTVGVGQLSGWIDASHGLDAYRIDDVLGSVSTLVGIQQVVPVGNMAGKSLDQSRRAKHKVERHGLYYLLEAKRSLGSR